MDIIIKYWPLITFVVGILWAIDKWSVTREIKELKLTHIQESSELKSENLRLLANQKHDSDYHKLLEITTRVDSEMRMLRDKASERHGEIQGKIGTIQLDLRGFTTRYTTQIDELYRIIGGRRSGDTNGIAHDN